MSNEDKVTITTSIGQTEWRLNDELHRTDGPAVKWNRIGIFMDRGTTNHIRYSNIGDEWWLNGKRYTKEEHFEMLSKEDKVKAVFNIDEWSE